jgi:hypothetical protein
LAEYCINIRKNHNLTQHNGLFESLNIIISKTQGLAFTKTSSLVQSVMVLSVVVRQDTHHTDIQHNDTQPNSTRYVYVVPQISHYAECYFVVCHFTECHFAECHFAEYHFEECHYAVCHYAECRGAYRSAQIIRI